MTDYFTEATNDHSAAIADVFDLPSEVVQPAAGAEAAPVEPPVAPAESGEGVVAPSPSPAPASAPAPAAPSVAPQPAAPAPAPTPAPTPPAADAPVSREEFNALMARLNAQPAPAAPTAAPAEAAPTPTPPAAGEPVALAEQPIDYRALAVPDQVYDAIFSEDVTTSKQGLNSLLAGLSQAIHTRLRAEMGDTITRYGERAKSEQSAAQQQQTVAQQRQQMQDQFYGKFPALNNPIARQIVSTVAGQLAVELPNATWDDAYMASLGARAQSEIAKLAGIAQPEAAPAAPTPAPAPVPQRPAAFVQPGARENGGNASTPSLGDEVQDLFSGG